MGKRAIRRYHKARMKKRARWVMRLRWSYLDKGLEWAEKYADHIKDCSCSGCGNQRRNLWLPLKERRTLQERRAGFDAEEQLNKA